MTRANLVTKTDFDTKLKSFNKKTNSNKKKHLFVENELKKLKAFDPANYKGKNYFGTDGVQNFLVFQPMSKFQHGSLKEYLTKLLNPLMIQLL